MCYNNSLTKLEEPLKKLLAVQSDLNHSLLVLRRSRVQPAQTVQENARKKRRKKENQRKSNKQSLQRLHKKCCEVLSNLLAPEHVSRLLPYLSKAEVPKDLQISKEEELKVQALYSLRPRFHLKALNHLKNISIFCGQAREHINCALYRLTSMTVTAASDNDNEKDNEDDDDRSNDEDADDNEYDDRSDDEDADDTDVN